MPAKRKRAEVAQRLSIRVNTHDNQLQAAFGALRHLLSRDADGFTEVDRSVWHDLIEELREGYEASRVRRVARQPRDPSRSGRDPSRSDGDRSRSEGDRSKSEGDRSRFERDAGKTSRSDAA